LFQFTLELYYDNPHKTMIETRELQSEMAQFKFQCVHLKERLRYSEMVYHPAPLPKTKQSIKSVGAKHTKRVGHQIKLKHKN
jgi:aspartate carbamoyltransferase catalytic subunit